MTRLEELALECRDNRMKIETLKIEVELYKNKLSKKAGLKTKDEEEVGNETNKNPQVLLNPNGAPVKHN